MTRSHTRLRALVLMMLTVTAVGTRGYALIEGWPILDSFCMIAITITTIGYREANNLSELDRMADMGALWQVA